MDTITKPWFVFATYTYYPQGGMDDFLAAFETHEAAVEYIDEHAATSGDNFDHYEIKDIRRFAN